jgi:hypothetical protein
MENMILVLYKYVHKISNKQLVYYKETFRELIQVNNTLK